MSKYGGTYKGKKKTQDNYPVKIISRPKKPEPKPITLMFYMNQLNHENFEKILEKIKEFDLESEETAQIIYNRISQEKHFHDIYMKLISENDKLFQNFLTLCDNLKNREVAEFLGKLYCTREFDIEKYINILIIQIFEEKKIEFVELLCKLLMPNKKKLDVKSYSEKLKSLSLVGRYKFMIMDLMD